MNAALNYQSRQVVVFRNSDFMERVFSHLKDISQFSLDSLPPESASLDSLQGQKGILLYDRDGQWQALNETSLYHSAVHIGFSLVPVSLRSDLIIGPWTKPYFSSCVQCKSRVIAEDGPMPEKLTPELSDPAAIAAYCVEESYRTILAKERSTTGWGKVFRFFRQGDGFSCRVGAQWKDPDCTVCSGQPPWEISGTIVGDFSSSVLDDARKNSYLSRLYHENSKIRVHQLQGDYMVPKVTSAMNKAALGAGKQYPEEFQRISLPRVDQERSVPIEQAILDRRSRRKFDKVPISLLNLSALLFYGNGITGKLTDDRHTFELPLRAAPSGGGLFPIEIYFVALHVTDIAPGIYYYDVLSHRAVLIDAQTRVEQLARFCGYPEMIERAAVLFILTAVFDRNQWKYWDRGYRVMMLDAGHIAHNIHLVATARKLPSCCIMGYVDDKYNEVIQVDGKNETTVYVISVAGGGEW